jgi:hypothetical protein
MDKAAKPSQLVEVVAMTSEALMSFRRVMAS